MIGLLARLDRWLDRPRWHWHIEDNPDALGYYAYRCPARTCRR